MNIMRGSNLAATQKPDAARMAGVLELCISGVCSVYSWKQKSLMLAAPAHLLR